MRTATVHALATFARDWNSLTRMPINDTLLEALTSPASKTAYARTLVARESDVFAIDDDAVDDLAVAFADPATRSDATARLLSYGMRPPWTAAGTSVEITLDRVYADRNGGSQHVMVIPAPWSTDLWEWDRDYDDDDGLTYHHWVAATLPSVRMFGDSRCAYQAVLVSTSVAGSLYWGDWKVSVFCGEVRLGRLDTYSDALAAFGTDEND